MEYHNGGSFTLTSLQLHLIYYSTGLLPIVPSTKNVLCSARNYIKPGYKKRTMCITVHKQTKDAKCF